MPLVRGARSSARRGRASRAFACAPRRSWNSRLPHQRPAIAEVETGGARSECPGAVEAVRQEVHVIASPVVHEKMLIVREFGEIRVEDTSGLAQIIRVCNCLHRNLSFLRVLSYRAQHSFEVN